MFSYVLNMEYVRTLRDILGQSVAVPDMLLSNIPVVTNMVQVLNLLHVSSQQKLPEVLLFGEKYQRVPIDCIGFSVDKRQ